MRQDGMIEPLKGLHFNRFSSPSECVHSVSIPAFCAIAQGSKEALLSSAIALQYDPMHYLLGTIELLIVSQILEEFKAQPYLSLRLDLDPTLLCSVMVEASDPSPPRGANVKAIEVISTPGFMGIVKSHQQSIFNYHSVFRPLLQQSTVNSQQCGRCNRNRYDYIVISNKYETLFMHNKHE